MHTSAFLSLLTGQRKQPGGHCSFDGCCTDWQEGGNGAVGGGVGLCDRLMLQHAGKCPLCPTLPPTVPGCTPLVPSHLVLDSSCSPAILGHPDLLCAFHPGGVFLEETPRPTSYYPTSSEFLPQQELHGTIGQLRLLL